MLICINMYKRFTAEDFIKKAKKVHGNKYDYSKVEYVNSRTKVCIICPEHGEFWQRANHHLQGSICPKCANNENGARKRFTTEEFIKRAKEVHGDKYDYSKTVYKTNNKKITIICHEKDENGIEHGEFEQLPYAHLNMMHGCPKCHCSVIPTTEDFIKKAREIHGDKYDYSKTEYINAKTNVTIICHEKDENGIEHGEFEQRPSSHISGCGCKKCATKNLSLKISKSTEEFIKKAKEVHGDKYDYSKVEYKNSFTKVCIICPEHGEFWQTPGGHIHNMQGCPNCIKSKLQNYIESLLKEEKLKFVTEKSFDWMLYKSNMKLDFYLSDYNIAIECQGGQHFIPVKKFGGENALKETVKRDNCKYDLCIKNNTDILYIIPYVYRNNEIFQKYYKNKRKYIFVNELRKNKKRIYKLL